jgi:hypothetical protein
VTYWAIIDRGSQTAARLSVVAHSAARVAGPLLSLCLIARGPFCYFFFGPEPPVDGRRRATVRVLPAAISFFRLCGDQLLKGLVGAAFALTSQFCVLEGDEVGLPGELGDDAFQLALERRRHRLVAVLRLFLRFDRGLALGQLLAVRLRRFEDIFDRPQRAVAREVDLALARVGRLQRAVAARLVLLILLEQPFAFVLERLGAALLRRRRRLGLLDRNALLVELDAALVDLSGGNLSV